jgi:hypothetical protein
MPALIGRRISTMCSSLISLTFLERYPSPADTRGLGEARLAGFLARERYPGRQTSAQLLAKLQAAPAGRVGSRSWPPVGSSCWRWCR